MFSLAQKVVYPGHGVARVSRIFKQKFGEDISIFCELKFLSKDMTVMVPMDRAHEVGVRPISSLDHIGKIF